MEWFNSPKLKKLQAKWYKKLKETGFKDAEQDEEYLKQSSGKTSIEPENPRDRNAWETYLSADGRKISESAKYNYYASCRRFLETFKFKNKTEKRIFEMHSEGIGDRVISKTVGIYRRKIQETIKRLKGLMRGV